MRELTIEETQLVSGAGFLADLKDVVTDPAFSDNLAQFAIDVYEAAVDTTSYVMGRVAGDLHSSYYQ